MSSNLKGYCWPISVTPGEDISFKISGAGHAAAQISRHFSISTDVTSMPAASRAFIASPQQIPAQGWRTGYGWPETFSWTVPEDCPSGIYSAECTDEQGNTCSISFVVRAHPHRRARIAVMANINTWLAYNQDSGDGKYNGAALASFLQPNPGAGINGDSHLTRGELWILGWLEREKYCYDVVADSDFHRDGLDAKQYRCLVVGTHPEYWTLAMRDRLDAYLAAGGSLAYLGGNGLFERAEYTQDGTGMTFREGVEGGDRDAALFRLLNPPRPERSVLGVATERDGVNGSPYVVQPGQAAHPLLAATGLKDGDFFGKLGLNKGYGNGMASAWEVDTSDGAGATGIMVENEFHPGKYHVPASTLPVGLVVLAKGVPDAKGPGADMTDYHHHAGGGNVFSAGSITFGGSLLVDPAIRQIFINFLDRASVPSPTWRPWFQVHPETVFDHTKQTVTALARNDHHVDLFTIGMDNVVWSTWWEPLPQPT